MGTLTDTEIGFYLGLTTVISGLITFIIRALLKSNCVEFRCCRILECKRDITHNPAELDLELN